MIEIIREAASILLLTFKARMSIRSREVEYELFYNLVVDFEAKFLERDSKHLKMKGSRGFHNSPGELVRIPSIDPVGIDRRRRQIQYGHKAISFYREVDPDWATGPKISDKAAIERGAALVYSRTDNYVTAVILYLPSTDNRRPLDEAYIIDILIPGKNMTAIRRFEKHALLLRSVAERYSFDGEPDTWDFIRTFRLKWFFSYVADSKDHPPRINEIALDISKWVITVGLSGFLLKWIIL